MSLIGERTCPKTGLLIVDQMTRDGVEQRVCGALPTPADHKMRALPGWEATTGITPILRAQWPSLQFQSIRTAVPILNQGSVGRCVASAGTGGLMVLRDRAGGTFQLLSDVQAYTEINGGFDFGANSGDFVAKAQSVGVCRAAIVSGQPLRPPGINATCIADAARFRLDLVIPLTTIEEVVTAAIYGWVLLFDVRAGGSYNTDSSGTVSYLGAQTNHEQQAGEGLRVDSSGKAQILGRNSWGSSWGVNGFGWYQEEHFTSSNSIWAMQRVIEDPNDPTRPPGLLS